MIICLRVILIATYGIQTTKTTILYDFIFIRQYMAAQTQYILQQ